RIRAEENGRTGSIRMGRREQRGQPASLGEPEERGAFGTNGIEHRQHVVYLLFQRWELCRSVGEPGSPHVKDDQSRERGEPIEESSKRRLFPLVLDVAERTREKDQVDRPATDRLVGDVDIAATGVSGLCRRVQ